MIAIVESNFILELALQRDEVEHAEEIVALAEKGSIELVVPACVFAESFQALTLNSKRRRHLESGLRNEIRELARSKSFADLEKYMQQSPTRWSRVRPLRAMDSTLSSTG